MRKLINPYLRWTVYLGDKSAMTYGRKWKSQECLKPLTFEMWEGAMRLGLKGGSGSLVIL